MDRTVLKAPSAGWPLGSEVGEVSRRSGGRYVGGGRDSDFSKAKLPEARLRRSVTRDTLQNTRQRRVMDLP